MDREHGPGRMPPAAEQACRLARPDGALIAYCVRRPGGEASAAAAAPLLLLHGLASNLTRYDEFVEHTALAARHALLRVDLRGHGGSLTRRRVDSALDAMARQALRSPQAEAEFVRRYSSARADLRHVPTSVYLQDLVEMFRPAPQPRTLGVPVLALLSSGATFADASAMRALLAGPQVRLQGIECQHWPLTERPREVREAIERWVQALTDA